MTPAFLRPGRRPVLTLLALLLLGAISTVTLPVGGAQPARAAAAYPYLDPGLPLSARVSDLLGRLTTAEKISLLHQYSPAISRLGIPAFRTGTEALHGVAWLGNATVFPQAVGLGSTWDPALVKQVGDAVGQEARGFHAQNPSANGLNLWAPVVNLLRDPRWGRNEEGYSEDPYLTGAISTAYGQGMQGDNGTYLQAAPTLKHYLAYNNEAARDTSSSVVPPRILHDYDEQAFRPAIAAGAATGVMPSYNLVNGRPATVNPDLNATLRSWTSNPLMVVSDAGAPANLVNSEHYFTNQIQADAAAIKAGLDSFTQDDANPAGTTSAINSALSQGLLTTADIDTAAGHVLTIRFRLGEFDPAGSNPYDAIGPSVINSAAHQQLARTAADEQVVLLKNSSATLPLSASSKKVAVVGPLSNTLYTDWYSGTMPYQVTALAGIKERLGSGATVTSSDGTDRIALKVVSSGRFVTAPGGGGGNLTANATSAGTDQAFDAVDWGEDTVTLRAANNSRYVTWNGGALANTQAQPNGWYVQQQWSLLAQSDGSYVIRYSGNDTANRKYVVVDSSGVLRATATSASAATRFTRQVVTSGIDQAVAAATGADAAVVVVGSMPFINGREDDDRATTVLPAGQEALVRAVQAANPRTVVVLQTSYPDAIAWEQANVPAILWTTHAGQETGHGIADVLFGDVNPTGRLTQTWYASDADLPNFSTYDISKSGHTYLYYGGTPLYPFGHGLSYSSFTYANLRLSSPSVASTGSVTVSVDVTNTSSRAGTEVVQLYTHPRASKAKQPVRQLRGFTRVGLAAGETRTATITLKAADLAFWDVGRERSVVETGDYDVSVGASSGDLRGTVVLGVTGETIPDRSLATARAAQSFDDYAGITLVDTSKASGTSVSATASGQWVSYRRVALGGATGLTARVSRAASGSTTVAVRLGSPTGTLAGTLTVPSTGDRYAFTTATASLTGATGTQDVYLVFGGAAQVDTIQLTGGSTTTTTTTTTRPVTTTTTTTTTRPVTTTITTTRPPTTTTTRSTTSTTTTTTTTRSTTGAASETCSATYAVTGQWPGGFQAEVTVRNPGAAPLSGWTVTWTYPSGETISSLWSGAYTQSGSAVTVTNATWNGTLAPSGSTTFGLTGTTPASTPPTPSLTCR